MNSESLLRALLISGIIIISGIFVLSFVSVPQESDENISEKQSLTIHSLC